MPPPEAPYRKRPRLRLAAETAANRARVTAALARQEPWNLATLAGFTAGGVRIASRALSRRVVPEKVERNLQLLERVGGEPPSTAAREECHAA